jgi:hypothetical protein
MVNAARFIKVGNSFKLIFSPGACEPLPDAPKPISFVTPSITASM